MQNHISKQVSIHEISIAMYKNWTKAIELRSMNEMYSSTKPGLLGLRF